MPKFLFIYHAGSDYAPPQSPEDGEAAMAAWGAWMGSIGTAFIDAGEPVGKSFKVDASGVSDTVTNPAFGWSIVEAPDLAAACDMAAGCPMIAEGGHVEVAQIFPMEL